MAEAAFGVELRRSRQAAALSLRQLATRVGYDHSYLSQVERGRRPGSAHLARLCDRALGTGSTLAAAYDGSDCYRSHSSASVRPRALPRHRSKHSQFPRRPQHSQQAKPCRPHQQVWPSRPGWTS